MLKYKACQTLPQGGLHIGLKVGILAEIGYMLHECALYCCSGPFSSGFYSCCKFFLLGLKQDIDLEQTGLESETIFDYINQVG